MEYKKIYLSPHELGYEVDLRDLDYVNNSGLDVAGVELVLPNVEVFKGSYSDRQVPDVLLGVVKDSLMSGRVVDFRLSAIDSDIGYSNEAVSFELSNIGSTDEVRNLAFVCRASRGFNSWLVDRYVRPISSGITYNTDIKPTSEYRTSDIDIDNGAKTLDFYLGAESFSNFMELPGEYITSTDGSTQRYSYNVDTSVLTVGAENGVTTAEYDVTT